MLFFNCTFFSRCLSFLSFDVQLYIIQIIYSDAVFLLCCWCLLSLLLKSLLSFRFAAKFKFTFTSNYLPIFLIILFIYSFYLFTVFYPGRSQTKFHCTMYNLCIIIITKLIHSFIHSVVTICRSNVYVLLSVTLQTAFLKCHQNI